MRICVENTNGYLPFQRKALEILLESPIFGLTFDIGHNRCAADADEAWILEHSNRLHHMHLHDVRGQQDHLPFGNGDLDLKPYLDLAQDRTAVIEVKTMDGLRKSVAWLNMRNIAK
jgi:sugar phosphate isomerase/epimerase